MFLNHHRSCGGGFRSRPPAGAFYLCRALAMLLVLLIVATAPTYAQMGGGHRHRQNDQQRTPQEVPAPPPPVPEVWPRLEDGAVICKSRDDLLRYQTQIANSANAPTAEPIPNCRTIRTRTGIEILARDGPSRTQIVTTDESKETGWTNSYLPLAPPSSAKGTSAGK
jgi:hypothetical protein